MPSDLLQLYTVTNVMLAMLLTRPWRGPGWFGIGSVPVCSLLFIHTRAHTFELVDKAVWLGTALPQAMPTTVYFYFVKQRGADNCILLYCCSEVRRASWGHFRMS